MFARKLIIEIVGRVLLIAIILFNALAPTVAFAKPSIETSEITARLENGNAGKQSNNTIHLIQDDYQRRSFENPINKVQENPKRNSPVSLQTSDDVLIQCVAATAPCSDTTPGVI